jgi:hypothetical protein
MLLHRYIASLVGRVRGSTDTGADTCNSGIIRTRTYGVDVPAMHIERHEWDIHVISLVTRGVIASTTESLLSHRSLV